MAEPALDQKLDILFRQIRNACFSKLSVYSSRSDLSVSEIERKALPFSRWMGIILISSVGLRITLKIHFKAAGVKTFAASIYGLKAEELTISQVGEFIKECCNLVAGAVKKSLESQGFSLGISLPILTRGLDEIFFPPPDEAVLYSDQWTVSVVDGAFNCSATVELSEVSVLQNLKEQGISNECDGSVEFL